MSFILDALKKSEEHRQQDQPPHRRRHIIALHGTHRRRWPLWLVLVLLPFALFSGWWLGKTSEEPVSPGTRPPVQEESLKSPPAKADPSPMVAESTRERVAVIPAPVPSRPQPPAPAPESRRPTESGFSTKSPKETQARTAVTGLTKGEAAPLPSYADLSREVKDRLPELEISLHFYSADPARRMVRLNDRLLREGDTVADGLTIDEITQSSTVFDYHGLRFQFARP